MSKKRPRRRRSTSRKASRTHAAVPRGLASFSVSDLNREIRRRQRGVKALHRRRSNVLAKIADIDAQILERSGSIAAEAGLVTASGTVRKRPKSDTSLVEALQSALKGQTMGIAEAMEAVQKAGYRSSSANFRTMVNIALLKKKHVKKVERGRYTAA